MNKGDLDEAKAIGNDIKQNQKNKSSWQTC